jgi:hypothetical protein
MSKSRRARSPEDSGSGLTEMMGMGLNRVTSGYCRVGPVSGSKKGEIARFVAANEPKFKSGAEPPTPGLAILPSAAP